MRRLFKENLHYTTKAAGIDAAIQIALNEIIAENTDVDLRDLELVIKNAAEQVCMEMILDRIEIEGDTVERFAKKE